MESCRDDHSSGLVERRDAIDIGTKTVGYFDPFSIMNYPCPHADDSRPIPQMTLSGGDKATIRELYGIRNAGVDRECVTACLNYARMDANLAKRTSASPEHAKCQDELSLSGSEPPRPEELTFNEYKVPAGGSISVAAPFSGSTFMVGPTSYSKVAPDAQIRVSVADAEKDGMPGYNVTFTLENANAFRDIGREIPSIGAMYLYEAAWKGPEGQAGTGDQQYFAESDVVTMGYPLFHGKASHTRWIPKGSPKYFLNFSKVFVQKSATPPATNSLFVQDLQTGEFLIDHTYYKLQFTWCEYAERSGGQNISPTCINGDDMRGEVFLRGIPTFLSRRDAAGDQPPGPATNGTATNQTPSGHFAKTRLSWQPSKDTDPVNYTVYVSTTANPQDGKAYFSGQNTYVDLTLNYGTKYFWSVVAYDGTYIQKGETWGFETAAAPFTLLCPPDTTQPLFAPNYGSHVPGNGDIEYNLRERGTNGLQLNRPSTVPPNQWRPIDYPDGTCIETMGDQTAIVLSNIPAEVTREHYLVVVANEKLVGFSLLHESASGPMSVNPGRYKTNPLWYYYTMPNIVYLGDYWGNQSTPEWRAQDRLLGLYIGTSYRQCLGCATSVKISKIFFTRKNPFLFDFKGFAGTGPRHEESPGVHIPLARVAPGAKLAVPLLVASGMARHSMALDSGSAAKGIALDLKANLLTWTPGAANLGRHVVTVTALNRDGPSYEVTHKLAIEVARLPAARKVNLTGILPLLLD